MNNTKRILLKAAMLLGVIIFLAILDQPIANVSSQNSLYRVPDDISIIPVPDAVWAEAAGAKRAVEPVRPEAGVDQGLESEPNDTPATADPLTGPEGKIKGYAVSGTPDVDYFSFNANAGDRVYAALNTVISTSSVNSVLELRNSSNTVLETDLDDGSFDQTSSSIAGYPITAPGTYYLRVRENASSTLRPYFLYFAVKPGAAFSAETESNNTFATANSLPVSGNISGGINPAGDIDLYGISLAAGDTIFISLDLDPDRDAVQWNGRLGLALFGTDNGQILMVNDTSAGSAANPLSEAFFFTVKDAGTYYIYVDEPAGGGGPAALYHLNATIIPAPSSNGCTIYDSTNVPQVIPAVTGLVSSTITVPPTTGTIRKVGLFIDATHNRMAELDVHLVSPAGNDNGVFTNVGGTTAGGAQTTMNWWIDDDAAIPPLFALSARMRHLPEFFYRLHWFKGENPAGTWRLDIRDDQAGNGGTLNNWSLEICEQSPPAGTLLYSENFETGMGGFTHSGTLDEWEHGTPATTATSTANPRAAFFGCGSGTGCWKTDLDNTYEANSSQDLVSPNLTAFTGSLTLSWAMRFQMESATVDHAYVMVREVGSPANNRIVWQFYDGTMTDSVGNPPVNIGESAGWGIYTANISDFSGKNIEVVFHLDSNNANNYPGLAIDDVQLRGISVTAASVPVSGRVTNIYGLGIPKATVTLAGPDGRLRTALTSAFGYYSFEDVEVGNVYVLSASRKDYRFDPRLITVLDEITDADLTALPNK